MVKKKKAVKKSTQASRKKAGKKSSKKTGKKAGKKTRKKKLTPIPEGYSTVTASLRQRNAQATLDFIQKVFGAKVRSLMPGPNGTIMHAQVRLGTSLIHVADAAATGGSAASAVPASLFVYVKNVDETVAKAVEAGAKVVLPPDNMFWGDRYAVVSDSQGNSWEIGCRVELVSTAEMKKRAKAMTEQMAAAGTEHS